MSRKTLSVLLAAFLVVGFASFMTKADVTGSFTAAITINPVPCGALSFFGGLNPPGTVASPANCEETFQKSDFESDLNINWTVSGLTIGADIVAGFTGIEDVLSTLKATLGALNVTDNFFFAVPFGADTATFIGANGQVFNETVLTVINPGNLLFVKKRVDTSISIAGITLDNLAEFGDVNFPMSTGGPCGGAVGSPCTALPLQSLYPNGYSAANQNFAFGDALTLSGQTVSGITVSSVTGLCLNPTEYENFKKASFLGVINPDCAGGHLLTSVNVNVLTTVTNSVTTALFNTGVVEAEGNGLQQAQSGSLTSFGFSPAVISVGAAQVTVVENGGTCGPGLVTNACSDSFTITNTGGVDALVNFALVGLTTFESITNIQCESFGSTKNNNQTMKIPVGGFTQCTWNATMDNGGIVATYVSLVSNPNASAAITGVVSTATSNATVTTTTEAKPAIFFDIEQISLSGVPIGPITGAFTLTFLPNKLGSPFELDSVLTYNSPIGAITAVFSTTDITQELLNGAELTISSGGVTLNQVFTASLAPLLTQASVSTTLNPDSNPATLEVSATICQALGTDAVFTGISCGATGLTDLNTTLSLKRNGLTLSVFSDLAGGPPVKLDELVFSLSAAAGPINLGATITAIPAWTGVFTVGVNF